jgi:hypothetical protein
VSTWGSWNPWKATAWANPPEITRSRRGKLAAERSVQVMCQRTNAPPPSFQPLQRQQLTALAARRDATCSACSSVWRSMSPPCGAITMSSRCRPLSQSRSTSSPHALAWSPVRVGCGPTEPTTPSNWSLVPSRSRPCAPCGRWCRGPRGAPRSPCTARTRRRSARPGPASRPHGRWSRAAPHRPSSARGGHAGLAGKPDPRLRRLPALVTEDRFGRAGSRQCQTALAVHTDQWDPRRPAPPLSWPELAATGRPGSR